jgi:hypothetical protein
VTPEQQEELIRRGPDAFSPEAGAWGRSGCTRVNLKAVDQEMLGEAMTLAWTQAAGIPKARRVRRRQSARKPR